MSVNCQLALQRTQFQKIAENDALIKAQRHDLRHQLTVLRELYTQNDREKLGRYLEALTEKLPSGREPALCENYAVNAVATHYADMASQAGAEGLGAAIGYAGTARRGGKRFVRHRW